MATPIGGHFVRVDGRTIFIRDSAPGSKRFPNQPTHSSGNMTHGTGMTHKDARSPVLLQQKSFGAMPGKGDWHGHGMAELIRLAGHHGLSRDETKQLMGRMNLNPAPNTVYIQHKRGVNHESLPSLNANHAAEFAQHIQAIKGGSLPPAPVTPPPKPPEPVKPLVTEPKPIIKEAPTSAESVFKIWTSIAAAQIEARSKTSFEDFKATMGKRWEDAAGRANVLRASPLLPEHLRIGKGEAQDYKVAIVQHNKITPTQHGEDYLNNSAKHTSKSLINGVHTGNLENVRKEDYNPVAVDEHGRLTDGNHCHAAGQINGDSHMLALVPTGPGTGKITNLEQAHKALTERLDHLSLHENFKPMPAPKGLMSADEFVNHIQTKHKALFDEHQAVTKRVAELEGQYKEQSKKLLSVEDPGSKIKLDFSKPVDWKAHQDAVAEARKGSGYQAEFDKLTSVVRAKGESINHRNNIEENLNKAIHQELTLPKEQQAKIQVTHQSTSDTIKLKAQGATNFLSSISHKDAVKPSNIFVKQIKGRAFHSLGTIHVTSQDTVHTHVHEIGHDLEYRHPSKLEAAQKFLSDRTSGKPVQPMKELTKVAGHSFNYDKSEVGKEGGFYHPYVGKLYSGSTEITSMGLEALHRNPAKFLKDDPGHFKFTLKQIRGV